MGPAGVYPAPVRCARRPRWIAPLPRAGRPATSRPSDHSRRPGIPALDGLRAVAVALVLADHGGIPGMGGGFLGVDIFFVLSGFLITSLLLDELGRTGRIDLAGFWIRRARRLLPALVLMVLTVAVGRQLFSPEAVAGLRDDAIAA
ncbi:acyltransferase family protein, partial [Mycobacterium sp.]|uniref:acyltransferase family protein n=1 Tax=Mycobacterium sp. TaxID=1785 RepID=UPI003D6BD925